MNDISSFFFYMWNAWSKQECDLVFGNMSEHFWNKWCQACNPDVFGAAERFYKELSENNRDLLVNRAVTIYNGFHKIQESEIWVCSVCGSEDIECRAWVKRNNTVNRVVESTDDMWCKECDNHCGSFWRKNDFTRKMDEWFQVQSMTQKHEMLNIKSSNTDEKNANYGWDFLDYEQKRNLFLKYCTEPNLQIMLQIQLDLLTTDEKQLLFDTVNYGALGDTYVLREFVDDEGNVITDMSHGYCINDASRSGHFSGCRAANMFRSIYRKLCPHHSNQIGLWLSHGHDCLGNGSRDMFFVRSGYYQVIEKMAKA